MSGQQWRSVALFGGALIAISFISPGAAMIVAGTVFVAIVIRAMASKGAALFGG